ncbi:MAG: hypothetical protein BroJett040_10830 [Oligoflexia bacterium]|nr:MAG: hypothetical protein BroJett040_10830 [Oligoflexia bacterium]
MRILGGLLFAVFVGSQSYAGVVDINTFYMSDVYSTTSDVKTTITAYDASLAIDIGTKKNYYIGLAYGSFVSNAESTATTTYTSTDTGIRLGYLFCKKNCVTTLTYNFITKVKYDDGAGNTPELRGTSLRFDIGYNVWFAENWALTLKFFYYNPTFVESVTSTTLTKISYKRTIMGPAVSLLWNF